MPAKVISTMTVQIFDNRDIKVNIDGVNGVNARMVETAERLLHRELSRLRALERHKANVAAAQAVNSPKTPAAPPATAKPSPPTTNAPK